MGSGQSGKWKALRADPRPAKPAEPAKPGTPEPKVSACCSEPVTLGHLARTFQQQSKKEARGSDSANNTEFVRLKKAEMVILDFQMVDLFWNSLKS